MSETPLDVQTLARAAVDAAEAECRKERFLFSFGTGRAKEVLDKHIAQALTEDRERCAMLVELGVPYSSFATSYSTSLIAAAIRTGQASWPPATPQAETGEMP